MPLITLAAKQVRVDTACKHSTRMSVSVKFWVWSLHERIFKNDENQALANGMPAPLPAVDALWAAASVLSGILSMPWSTLPKMPMMSCHQ